MEKLVLLRIADRINTRDKNPETHVCWPGVASLAADCGVDKRTVMKYTRRLRDRGILEFKREAVGRQSRKYSINLQALSSGAPDAPQVNVKSHDSSGAFPADSGAFGARSGPSDAPKPLEPKTRTANGLAPRRRLKREPRESDLTSADEIHEQMVNAEVFGIHLLCERGDWLTVEEIARAIDCPVSIVSQQLQDVYKRRGILEKRVRAQVVHFRYRPDSMKSDRTAHVEER